MTEAEPTQRHDPYAALRVSSFWRYLLGLLLIQIGMGAQGLAIGWEIYERTNQPITLGLVAGIQAVPMILLSLPAGYLADRFDRRRLMAVCLFGVAVCSLGLAWVSFRNGPITLMYLLLFFDATFATLQRPAGMSILPAIVPLELFESAIKWRSTMDQISGVAGPALGAFIYAWSKPAAYITNAVCALIFVSMLLTVQLRPYRAATGMITWRNVLAGVQFVWKRNVLLAAISLDLFAVLLGGAIYLLPIYAKDILHIGVYGLGWLRMAPAVGALAMALLLAHLPPIKRAGRTMLLSVAGFGVATIVFGLSTDFWLSWVMLFFTGALDNVSVVIRHTLVQLLTPDDMRGRVSAVNLIFIGSSNEIGGLESGIVAQRFGPIAAVVSGGIGTLLVVAIWAATFRHLRRFGALSSAVEKQAMKNTG